MGTGKKVPHGQVEPPRYQFLPAVLLLDSTEQSLVHALDTEGHCWGLPLAMAQLPQPFLIREMKLQCHKSVAAQQDLGAPQLPEHLLPTQGVPSSPSVSPSHPALGSTASLQHSTSLGRLIASPHISRMSSMSSKETSCA